MLFFVMRTQRSGNAGTTLSQRLKAVQEFPDDWKWEWVRGLAGWLFNFSPSLGCFSDSNTVSYRLVFSCSLLMVKGSHTFLRIT